MKLDDLLCFALYNASRAITRAYAPLLEPLGLTYPQLLVLFVLFEEDGAPVKRIGQLLALDSATLTPMIKRLELQGLVQRRRGVKDERIVEVRLTPAGRALQKKAQRVPGELACRVGLDPKRPAARERVRKLRTELQQLTREVA